MPINLIMRHFLSQLWEILTFRPKCLLGLVKVPPELPPTVRLEINDVCTLGMYSFRGSIINPPSFAGQQLGFEIAHDFRPALNPKTARKGFLWTLEEADRESPSPLGYARLFLEPEQEDWLKKIIANYDELMTSVLGKTEGLPEKVIMELSLLPQEDLGVLLRGHTNLQDISNVRFITEYQIKDFEIPTMLN